VSLKNATNSSASTTVNGGTLIDGAAGAVPNNSAVTVNSGSQFDLSGNSLTVSQLLGGGTVLDTGAAATITINNAATDVFPGSLTNAANPLTLVKTGAGSLFLSNAAGNTYTGGTQINGKLLINNTSG